MANELTHKTVGTQLTQAEYEAVGGHVLDSQAAGDIIYASSTSQLSRLGIGTAGKVLMTNSGASAPEWSAAITGVTSIYATDLIMGEDSQTAIDFGTANEIDFKVDNAARLTLTTGALYPVTNNQIDLGTSSLEFKDAFFDGTVTADAFAGPLTGNVTGTASVATTVTITDNESTNEDNAIIFTAGGDVDGGNLGLESDGTMTYNPSTGKITATGFIGALTGNVTGDVTGNVTGNVSGTAATVTTAAQSNITSLGTLTTLTVDNVIVNGTTIGHTSDTDLLTLTSANLAIAGAVQISGNLDVTGSLETATIDFTDGDLAITIADGGGVTLAAGLTSTAASNTLGATSFNDANITNVGDIDIDTLSADDNDIDIVLTDNRATALEIKEGSNTYMTFVTTNSSEKIQVGANDAGYDVIFYGDTASANMTWDTSADDLILNGGAGLIVPDGQLTLGSTAIAATATEINTVADGNTSVGTTAIADGDGVVINDAGTMRQATVQTLAAYLDDEITAMPNLVSVGTIGTGTWQGTAIASGYIAADAITGAKIADDTIDSEHYIDGSIDTAHIADNQITLAKMAGLARGKIIYGDASGDPAALALGSDNHVLTVNGSDINWEAAPAPSGAQTGITTILNTSTKIGRDSENLIDFATTDNKIIFRVNNVNEVELVENALSPVTSDGVALGTSSLMWSDAFLASGGVLNFNNGDMTVTHSSNTLTVAGGTLATAALTASTGTFSGILKTDDTTNATSTTDGSLQTDGGLSVALDAIFGDDVTLITDSAVLNLGVGSDVSITHDGTTGGTITGTPMVYESKGSATLANDKHSGVVLEMLAGESIAVGDWVYADSTDGRVSKADANDTGDNGHYPAIGVAVSAQGSAGSAVKILTHGVYNDSDGFGGSDLTEGNVLYLSETAGGVTATAPSDDGDIVQVCGIAIGPRDVFVNPSLDMIEHD